MSAVRWTELDEMSELDRTVRATGDSARTLSLRAEAYGVAVAAIESAMPAQRDLTVLATMGALATELRAMGAECLMAADYSRAAVSAPPTPEMPRVGRVRAARKVA